MVMRPNGEQRVRAFREYFINYMVSIYPVIVGNRGEHYGIKNIEWQELEENTLLTSENLVVRLEVKAAQELMDDLWQCGLRPSEGTGSAGQSVAQQDHIKDLRSTTDRLLGIVEKTLT
jgi:hypothetical protein